MNGRRDDLDKARERDNSRQSGDIEKIAQEDGRTRQGQEENFGTWSNCSVSSLTLKFPFDVSGTLVFYGAVFFLGVVLNHLFRPVSCYWCNDANRKRVGPREPFLTGADCVSLSLADSWHKSTKWRDHGQFAATLVGFRLSQAKTETQTAKSTQTTYLRTRYERARAEDRHEGAKPEE